MLKRLREKTGSESGFTLIELLVVMLILGILAAIAIPAFFNQRSKANDAQAKAQARTLQTAAETYATDNNGSYDPPGPLIMNVAALDAIEPTIDAPRAATPLVTGTSYTVTSTAPTTNTVFRVLRDVNGNITRTCQVTSATNPGGCTLTAGVNGTW